MAVSTGTLSGPLESRGSPTLPISIVSRWAEVITGNLSVADNATITTPETQITDSTRVRFTRDDVKLGTSFQIRAFRLASLAGTITNPVVNVFGRKKGSGDGWQRLPNKDGEFDIEFDFAGSVTTTGDYTFTDPTTAHTIDMSSCDEFLIGVSTAFNADGGTGSVADSGVEVKIL